MKEISIPIHCLEQMKEGLRLAANILESRKRETAADRQIEFAERLANWLTNGRKGDMPRWIPDKVRREMDERGFNPNEVSHG